MTTHDINDQILIAIKAKLSDSDYMKTALTQVLAKIEDMTKELHQAQLEAMQNLIKMQNSIKKCL